jgi:Spy/CpxP family protein refolding chaperone
MNNTTRTLAIAAILAATLALGTFATTTTTTQSAFAYLQKKGPQQDNNRGHEIMEKVTVTVTQ